MKKIDLRFIKTSIF